MTNPCSEYIQKIITWQSHATIIAHPYRRLILKRALSQNVCEIRPSKRKQDKGGPE